MAVSWEYYNDKKFEEINDKYLPSYGEGETKATQKNNSKKDNNIEGG